MKKTLVMALAAVATFGALSASAQVTRQLTTRDANGNIVDSGWAITISDPAVVDLIADSIIIQNGTVIVQKFAEFRTIDPFTGLPQPVTIQFSQTLPDAQTMNRIVITDELITNSTNVAFTAFRMALLPSSGVASFDPIASAGFSTRTGAGNTGTGFNSTSFSNNNTDVIFTGGPGVGPGQVWAPGLVSGGLVINVDLSGSAPAVFTLKEIPLPTPGAAALMGLGALAATRRRR